MEDTGPTTTRIQVVVRVRPVLPNESSEQVAVTCSEDGGRVQVQLPDKGASGKELLPGTNRSAAKSYGFDACLPGRTTQSELAEVCSLEELVGQALDGYSVTIFAFGQTGSGKTHTMVGPRLSRAAAGSGPPAVVCDDEDGLLPRCLMAAYAGIQQRSDRMRIRVTTSCVELYNEAVTDLLGPDKAKQLQVRKEERGGFRVEGLTQVECGSAGAALSSMSRALVHRHTRAHALNEYSSRSHCLMTFTFDSQEEGQGMAEGAQGGVRRHGKLVLVDLAGSERLKETGNSGRDAVRETGAINKSLFTLGQVLAALAAKSGRSHAAGGLPVHVPFRDSKLTQLLWDGLRGAGRVLMLACLGPLGAQAEESLNTLHFASMALRIKAQPVMFMDPQDALVLELRTTIRQLQEENRQLATAMNLLSSGTAPDEVFSSLPEALRLAAARNAMGSAPAQNQTNSHQASSKPSVGPTWPPAGSGDRSNTEAGVASPVRPVPKPGAKGGQRSTRADVLSVSHGSLPTQQQQTAHQQLLTSLLASPVDYSYTLGPPAKNGKHKRAPAAHLEPASLYAPGSLAHESSGPRHPLAAHRPLLPITAQSSSSTLHPQPSRLPAVPSTLSSDPSRLALAAPQLDAFPELAALEAQFQMLLGGGAPQAVSSRDGSEQRDQDRGAPATPPEVKPEPKALSWAERNTWFGEHQDMTAHAYDVHDDLVNNQGVDASTDAYYKAIEQRVKERFPEQWAAWEDEVAKAASAAAARAALGPPKPPPPPTSHNFGSTLRVMGLKDPMPWEASSPTDRQPSMFAPQRGLSNPHMLERSRFTQQLSPAKAAKAAPTHKASTSQVAQSSVRRSLTAQTPSAQLGSLPSTCAVRQHVPPHHSHSHASLPSTTQDTAVARKQVSSSLAQGHVSSGQRSRRTSNVRGPKRAPSPLEAHSHAGGALTGSPGLKRGTGADHMSAAQQQQLRVKLNEPISTASGVGAGGVGKSWAQSPKATTGNNAGVNMLRKLDISAWSNPGGLPTDMSIAQLQAEYMRQRFAVLEELRQAKAEAEQERARILAKIGRTLGNSRWRQ